MAFSCLGIGVSVFAFGAIPVIQSIYHPEKVLREAILTPVKEELDRIIAQLIAKYEQGQLEYALERVTFGAAQKRLQNALTIGALDKVGLLPLLIGTGISLIALWKEPLFSANLFLVSGIAGGVVLVYLAAISQQRALLRLDTVALALKHAVAAKKLSSEDRGPNPTSLLPGAQ
jgi:hypothetical protein